MRDLNFFEAYIEKREFKLDRKLIYSSLGLLIVLLFFMYSIFNYINIKQEEKIVASLKEIAENEKTLEKVEEIKDKEIEVAEFKKSVGKIILLDESLEETDIISKGLLDDINKNMPSGVFITSITMNTSEIHIVGIAEDKWGIAEFGKGLEDIDYLGDVFVSNISNQEDHYSFNINIMAGDVMIDAEIDEDIIEEDEG